jgi:phytanoyl-CoA hydroxylase
LLLSRNDVSRYREQGFIVLPEAVPGAEIDEFLNRPASPLPSGHTQPTLQRHKTDPRWAYMAGHPRLVPLIHELLGGAPRVLQTMYLPKPRAGPGVPRNGVDLHRDQLYIRADPPRVMVCWIAMSDTDADNGGLQVVPGSHLWSLASFPTDDSLPTHYRIDQLLRGPDGREWNEEVPRYRFDQLVAGQVETLAVPKGGAVLFDGLLIHGSGSNRSPDRERLAFTTHYAREDAWVYRVDLQDTVAPGELVEEG